MGTYRKYDEDFKKSLVNLYHSGKTQTMLSKEYGVSTSALTKWIKMYSEVKIDDDTVLTAKQIRELQIWCSDITYIKTGRSFSYLCVIIDLFSRKVISYNVSNSMSSQLVIDTLDYAVKTRNPQNPVLFHSDQGVQYTSELTRKFCDEHNLVQSFSAKAHQAVTKLTLTINAVAESFFKHLKHEDLNRKSFRTIRELRLAVFRYIDCFYNTLRPHSAIDMLSPVQKESL